MAFKVREQLRGDFDQGWVEAMIEIPRGSRNKYEYDHERGVLRLDRVLYAAVHYPTDYGYIPGTLGGDGDPLDILVLVDDPIIPGCVLRARPVGVLITADEKGMDEKVLAVPMDDPRFAQMVDLSFIPEHRLREIANFFATYKELQGVHTIVRDWLRRDGAWQIIQEAGRRFEHEATMVRAKI